MVGVKIGAVGLKPGGTPGLTDPSANETLVPLTAGLGIGLGNGADDPLKTGLRPLEGVLKLPPGVPIPPYLEIGFPMYVSPSTSLAIRRAHSKPNLSKKMVGMSPLGNPVCT